MKDPENNNNSLVDEKEDKTGKEEEGVRKGSFEKKIGSIEREERVQAIENENEANEVPDKNISKEAEIDIEDQNSIDSDQEESRKSLQLQKQKAMELLKKIESQQAKNDAIEVGGSLIHIKKKYDGNDIEDVRLAIRNKLLEWAYLVVTLATLGILEIANIWTKGKLKTKIIYKKEENLENANSVIIVKKDGSLTCVNLTKKNIYLNNEIELDTFAFEFNYQVYIWDDNNCHFKNLRCLSQTQKVSALLADSKQGKTEDEVSQLKATFGVNVIDLTDKPLSVKSLAILSRPLAIFQILSLFVLFYLRYHAYFYFVLIYSIFEFISELNKSRSSFNKLREDYFFNEKVMVIRSTDKKIHKKKIVDSTELVPGDLIEITNNLVLPADVMLIYGSCIVQNQFNDENPDSQTKFSIDAENECTVGRIPKKSMLYTGDKITYTINHINEGCFGIVISTGFNTIKGNKLRTVLNRKSFNFYHKRDAYILFVALGCLALVTACGLIVYERLVLKKHYFTLSAVLSKIFQLFIITLKPTIPMALFAATAYSAKRLLKKGVSSNDLNRLNDVGKTKTFLIEQELVEQDRPDKVGFLLCKHNEDEYKTFDKTITNINKLTKLIEFKPIIKKYIECFGLCNTVTKLNEEYFGSQIEIEMLKNSVFDINYKVSDKGHIERVLETNPDAPDCFSSQYKVLRYFESKDKQNTISSIVIQNKEGEIYLYSKGAPFDFSRKCKKSSIPYNFAQTISKCASKGYRCTALGFKKLEANEVQESQIKLEQGLRFLGFYLNKTEIRQGVESTVTTLTDIDLGFTTLSASSVYLSLVNARKCGMLSKNNSVYIGRLEAINNVETLVWQKLVQKSKDQTETSSLNDTITINEVDLTNTEIFNQPNCSLALTGKAYRYIVDNETTECNQTVLEKCRVFGDLKEKDKLFVMSQLKTLSDSQITYINSGDASINLVKIADTSIALKDTKTSSINSFTASDGRMSKLVDIVTESRTSLINKHKNFEFLCYFIILQFFGLLLLFSKHTNYAASQIFFSDILVLLITCYFQASFGPLKLKKEIPCRSIFSHKFISTTLTYTGYGIFFLWSLALLLWKTKFYKTPSKLVKHSNDLSADHHKFYDPFVVFIFFIYLNVRFVISINTNIIFNKRVVKNLSFLIYCLFLLVVPFMMLFANELVHQPTKQFLKDLFKIPNLHGFEFLIILLSVFMLFGFYLVRWVEKRFIRKWTGKYKLGAVVEETSNNDQTEQHTIVSDSNKRSLRESRAEKKSRASKKKSVSSRRRGNRRRRGDDDSILNSSISRIEKKTKHEYGDDDSE